MSWIPLLQRIYLKWTYNIFQEKIFSTTPKTVISYYPAHQSIMQIKLLFGELEKESIIAFRHVYLSSFLYTCNKLRYNFCAIPFWWWIPLWNLLEKQINVWYIFKLMVKHWAFFIYWLFCRPISRVRQKTLSIHLIADPFMTMMGNKSDFPDMHPGP